MCFVSRFRINRVVTEMGYFVVEKTKVSPHTCGTLGNSKNVTRIRRIVGGISSDYGAWPWQAAISYNSTSMYSTLELLANKSTQLHSLPPWTLSFWLRTLAYEHAMNVTLSLD